MTDLVSSRSVVERELKQIYDERHQLVPAEVVEVAKNRNHPLHVLFEWDDTVAGAAYRNVQATQLIRSVQIRVSTETATEVEDHKVRAWVPARYAGEAKPGYVPAEGIQSPEQRQILLRQIKREIAALHRRYGHTEAFWSTLDELHRPALPAAEDSASTK